VPFDMSLVRTTSRGKQRTVAVMPAEGRGGVGWGQGAGRGGGKVGGDMEAGKRETD
jgi:hypothetical protein